MLKSTVVAIVLTLAIGPNVQLLCRASCHPLGSSPTECHHEDSGTSSRVTPRDDCASVVLVAAAVVREEVRRGTSDTTAPPATMAEAGRFTSGTSGASRGHMHGRIPSFEGRPIVHQLRI